MDTPTNVLSICSGYGGLDLGIRLAIPGARTVCYVEREAYCCELLATRMEAGDLDPAPMWTDLRSFDGQAWRGVVDLVAGGIPCQPHSVAGKQLRGADERDLIDDFLRVVSEARPGHVFVENVGGFAAWDGGGRLLAGLSALGLDAEWTTVRASDVGAPHRRERVFVLAYRNDEGQRQPSRSLTLERRRIADGCQGVGDAGHELRAGWSVTDAERGSSAGRGELGHPRRPRLEVRGGDAKPGALPAAWPPGPSNDWTGIPEHLWPATTESVLRRVAHGPAHRLDRLRALGNGVVPAQAALALRVLSERILTRNRP